MSEPDATPRSDFWWQRKITELEAALADARRRAEEAEDERDESINRRCFLTEANDAAEKKVKELTDERDRYREDLKMLLQELWGDTGGFLTWEMLLARAASVKELMAGVVTEATHMAVVDHYQELLATAEADALERAAVVAVEKGWNLGGPWSAFGGEIATAIRALKPEGRATDDALERAAVKMEEFFADRSVGREAAAAIRSLK